MNREDIATVILCVGLVVSFSAALLPSRRRFWSRDMAGGAVLGICAVAAGLIIGTWKLVVLGLIGAVLFSAWARSSWRQGR